MSRCSSGSRRRICRPDRPKPHSRRFRKRSKKIPRTRPRSRCSPHPARHRTVFGSTRSRRPSPRKLNPSTSVAIASPGKIVRCGASKRCALPASSIVPQLGVGRLHLDAPHLTVFPGLAIATLMLGIHSLGIELRDHVDPKMVQVKNTASERECVFIRSFFSSAFLNRREGGISSACLQVRLGKSGHVGAVGFDAR